MEVKKTKTTIFNCFMFVYVVEYDFTLLVFFFLQFVVALCCFHSIYGVSCKIHTHNHTHGSIEMCLYSDKKFQYSLCNSQFQFIFSFLLRYFTFSTFSLCMCMRLKQIVSLWFPWIHLYPIIALASLIFFNVYDFRIAVRALIHTN